MAQHRFIPRNIVISDSQSYIVYIHTKEKSEKDKYARQKVD